jgi:ArsR family transcriptional regulator, arsenate/arsenite/antimonite-responsive transcriptional repressor / arsenate reductase (thioredoxin)
MVPPRQAAAPPPFLQLAAHPLRWQLLTELAASDHRVRDLVTRVDQPQNLVSYHLRQLRDAGLVNARRSTFDGRDSYYRLDLDRCAAALDDGSTSLHPALRRGSGLPSLPVDLRGDRPVSVLFVCTGNSSRSPIAEALLRHHTGGTVTVVSAGTSPQPRLHPNTLRVLREGFGIDISTQEPRHVDTIAHNRFGHVITLCDRAREACPDFTNHPQRSHWSMTDPATAGQSDRATYRAFERAASEIDTRVQHLLPVLAAARN